MVLFGPDISHHKPGMDFARIAAEGHTFLFSKVSEGASFKDSEWPRVRDQAPKAGLVVCGYHYVKTDNPDAQAATCAAWLGDKSMPVILDWEANGGNFANLVNVLAAFRRAGLRVPMVYTGSWYWQQVGSPNMASLGLPLWKSRYPSNAAGSPAALYAKVPASYWAAVGGLDTKILQYTSNATIAGKPAIDCSAFLGTRDELIALLGLSDTSTPTTPGDDMASVDQDDWNTLLQIAKDAWAQLAGQDAKPGEYTGWPSKDGGSGNALTLVDYARQADVQLNGLKSAGATGGLSEADKEDIAERVAEKLAARMAQ